MADDSALPSVRLPFVDAGTPAEESSQVPPAASSLAAQGSYEDLDEEDLFGSASEDDGGAGGGSALVPVGAAGQAQPDDNYSERDLFGEDDAEEPNQQPDVSAPASSLGEDLDERDIFGSDDESGEEQAVDVVLRRRPAPPEDRVFKTFRLPNVLSIETQAFSPRSCHQAVLSGYKAGTNTQNKSTVRLLNPENCIRWRFSKGSEGNILQDDSGKPLYESNARIVEWEDGSKTLYVGKEVFPVSEIDEKIALFEENTPEVSVCHGFIHKRMVATPKNLNTASHDALKRAQFEKYEATRRSLLATMEERQQQEEVNQQLQNERKRLQDKKVGKGRTGESAVLRASFLEDEEPLGDGPSVLAIKQAAHKRQRT